MSAEMKNTLVESKLLRDGYRCVKHASGLTVFIYPVSYTHLTLPTTERV